MFQIYKIIILCVSLFLFGGVIVSKECEAQQSLEVLSGDKSPNVVRHDKRPSGVEFSVDDKKPIDSEALVFRAPKYGKNVYKPSEGEENPGMWPVLPVCAQDRVVREEVGRVESGESEGGLLFYLESDAGQRTMAKKAKSINESVNIVGYEAGKRDLETFSDEIKSLPLSMNVTCLPTRVLFVVVGGRRYMEYREGGAAWNDEKYSNNQQ